MGFPMNRNDLLQSDEWIITPFGTFHETSKLAKRIPIEILVAFRLGIFEQKHLLVVENLRLNEGDQND